MAHTISNLFLLVPNLCAAFIFLASSIIPSSRLGVFTKPHYTSTKEPLADPVFLKFESF